jgi:hypothetical protein
VAAGLTLTRVGGAKRGRAAAQSGVEAPTLCEALVLGGGEAMARLNLEIWPPVWALFCKLHVFFGTTTGLESDGLRWPFAQWCPVAHDTSPSKNGWARSKKKEEWVEANQQ